MATIYAESGFNPYARPPRTLLLGFIPWTRPSSAYGYSQALDGTWSRYRGETGHWGASRTNFADAIDFIGWYHAQSHSRTASFQHGYSLYLAYLRTRRLCAGAWRGRADIQRSAQRVSNMALPAEPTSHLRLNPPSQSQKFDTA